MKQCRYIAVALLLVLMAAQAKQPLQPKKTIPLWSMVLNSANSDGLPCRFRATWDKIPDAFDTTGFCDLNMLGSGQFSNTQFKSVVNYLGKLGVSPNEIVVVDLREEPHAFINGHAFSWHSKGAWWIHSNPVSLVLSEEKMRLASLSLGQCVSLKRVDQKDKSGRAQRISEHSYKIDSLQTEEQIVNAAGAHYIRLPVTDHMRPDDRAVDQFLHMVKALPPHTSVYFHCRGGRGRTSTFMVMYDIIRNPQLPLKIIIDRQVSLGSVDIRRLSGPLKSHKHPNEKARHHFINLFYEYLHAPNGYGQKSWTKWVTQRKLKASDYDEKTNTFSNSRETSLASGKS